MKITPRPEFFAAVLAPDPADDPADLEDVIHDQIQARGMSELRQVVLDLSQVDEQAAWLKAAGPEIPDTNLRVALGAVGYQTARALRLDALFEWYPDVESALRATR